MKHITSLIIGAGQAGLAMSYHLTEKGVNHALLERGQVANSWRTERWDSLRLLTPNWQSRLPGYTYTGDKPDGYRTMNETTSLLQKYSDQIAAPVQTETSVQKVRQIENGYHIQTDRDEWTCRCLVLASGACNIPKIPNFAAQIPSGIQCLTPMDYRNPGQLANGGVLIVGASATGVQLAYEIHQSGRPVTLATGEHVRAPRSYRGRDIQYWMDRTGLLDIGADEIDDIRRARSVPSMQLVGHRTGNFVDLNSLQAIGVRIAGRAMGINGNHIQFSGSLANVCRLADLKANRLLKSIDEWIKTEGLQGTVPKNYQLCPTIVPNEPPLNLDLVDEGIKTVIWATGFRPDYSWLDVAVVDSGHRLRHTGGIVDAPGLYVLGLPFLRTRKSSLIDGVGQDAAVLSSHLKAYLDSNTAIAA